MTEMNNTNTAIINAIVNNERKGAFVGITALTTPSMRKKNNPYLNRVQKLTNRDMRTFADHQSIVNRRLVAEGKEPIFESEPLPYGMWVVKDKYLTYNGNVYLRLYLVENKSETTMWLLDGRVATDAEVADIKTYLTGSSTSRKQSECGLTEHQSKPRNYLVDNIISLRIGGIEVCRRKEKEKALAFMGAEVTR